MFVVVGTVGNGIPIALYLLLGELVLGERSEPVLDELRGWMAQHSPAIMTVLCLIIGAKLLGDGISGL